MKEKYENKMDRKLRNMEVFAVVYCLVLSAVLAAVTQKWIAGMLPLIIAGLLAILFPLKNIRQFPIEVEFNEQGLILTFRRGSRLFIEWTQVADMCLPPQFGYGSFRIKGSSRPYHVLREIASRMESGYLEAMGVPIPRWNGKRTSKVSPKTR